MNNPIQQRTLNKPTKLQLQTPQSQIPARRIHTELMASGFHNDGVRGRRIGILQGGDASLQLLVRHDFGTRRAT
jgi:hypothetical protein